MELYLLKGVTTQKLNCLGTLIQIGVVTNLIEKVLQVMFLCMEEHQSLSVQRRNM